MRRDEEGLAMVVMGLSLIANLIVLGLNMKLYTEYFKDRAINSRVLGAKRPNE